jgi:hypothetical protein
MRDQNEEAKLPRLRCPYCSGVLERVAAATAAANSPVPFACRGDVKPSPASCSRNVVLHRIVTSGEWVSVLKNREVSIQPPTKPPEENPRGPQGPRWLDVPDESLGDEPECVDDPDSEEEPDGYGHGV